MSVGADSLITDEARSWLGREVVHRTGIVSRDAFQRWARAAGDHNPLYFDAVYARSLGYRDVLMPTLFLQDIVHATPDLDQLQADGIPRGDEPYSVIPLPRCPRKMLAGSALTALAPVHPGDEITESSVISGLVQKQGRSGAFVLLTWTTTYTRGGEVVATEERTVFAREEV